MSQGKIILPTPKQIERPEQTCEADILRNMNGSEIHLTIRSNDPNFRIPDDLLGAMIMQYGQQILKRQQALREAAASAPGAPEVTKG